MLHGTATRSCPDIKPNYIISWRPLLAGYILARSIAIKNTAGMQIGKAISILEEAVCRTAVFAAILDLPIGLPVSGSLSKIPACISALLMNQLLAKPPHMQATVLVKALSMMRRAPVADADLFALI